MPYSILGTAKGPLAPSNSATIYYMLSAYLQGITTEANSQFKVPVAGTFRYAVINLDANTSTGGNQVLTLRKNGADTALVVNVVNGISTLRHENTSDSVHVDAGDLVNWKYVTTSTGSIATIRGIYVYFIPDDLSITMTCFGAGVFSTPVTWNATQNLQHLLFGRFNSGETFSLPSSREFKFPIAGDLTNWGMRSSSGGKSVAQRVYKNQSDDGVDRVVFAQDVSGFAYHDANPISIAVDDAIINRINVGSSGGDRVVYHNYAWFKNLTQKSVLGFADQLGLALAGTASTTYYSIFQGGGSSSTDENDVAWPVKIPCTLSRMSVSLSSNTTNSGSSTFRLRKNGAFANQSITVAAGASANTVVQDLSNTDTLAVDDEICVQVNPAGTSGTIGWLWMAFAVNDDNTYVVPATNGVEKLVSNKFITKV